MTLPSHFDGSAVSGKVCRGCGSLKPTSEFYAHSRMADGRLSFCKTCVKSRVNEHRQNNLDRIKEYDRNRPNHRERVVANIERVKRLYRENPEPFLRTKQEWAERNRHKVSAQRAVRHAIRDGKMIPQPCEVCGGKAQAHHEDYSKPLEVKWLCPTHHGARHRHINELRRQGVSVSA